MVDSMIGHAPYIAAGLVVLLVFVLIATAVSNMLIRVGRDTRIDQTLATLFARLSQTSIMLVGLLVAAVIMLPNFRPVDALAGMGIASVAIGFAMKDVLQNFFSGMLILWRKPFRIGDEIRLSQFEGTVIDINIRATQLRTYSGTVAVIPNSEIYTSAIEVLTARSERRVEVIVGIGYGASLPRAKSLILDVLKKMDGVTSPAVYVSNFSPSTIDLRIHFWSGARQYKVLQNTDHALIRIKEALDAAGIDIPFPHQVVLLRDETAHGSARVYHS
jgi:small conductance mechanosensitive channel